MWYETFTIQVPGRVDAVTTKVYANVESYCVTIGDDYNTQCTSGYTARVDWWFNETRDGWSILPDHPGMSGAECEHL